MHSIRTAIIGAGFMGPTHTEALRRLGIEVAGILGVDEAESTKAAQKLGLPRAYLSYTEVLKDKNVHAVHITTPNRLHFQMARDALKAGKHVLCEKPLAMNTRETAALVDLAKKSKLAACVNYNLRYYPLCMEAREMVQENRLGKVHSIVGSYVQDWLLYQTDYNWRILAEEGGSLRAIADIGTHWLDMVQHITGLRVVALCADLLTIFPVRKRPKGEVESFSGKVQKIQATEDIAVNTEDGGAILLRFDNGAKGTLFVSQISAGRKNCLRWEISGGKSAVYWDSETPNEMWVGHRDKANEKLLKDPGLLSEAVRPYVSYPGGHNEGYPDTFKQCFKAFYAYIAKGDFKAKPTFPTFLDGHREVVLCEAIAKSNKKNSWVTVE
ncbi:Gfo/Idh/MocA family oxidoreductase [bacterium]|nr:Gfo/Idh/MocA family oxidoreductase [bacterium]